MKMNRKRSKADTLEGIAMSIVAICRLEKCSMWDVFERFNIPEKMQKEIAPIVANNLEVYEKIFDKVDEMSDEEFRAFARKMEGKK